MKLTSCKEMGGATSNACQSGTRTVSKQLIPSTGRFAVIGCKLQVLLIILYTHNIMLMIGFSCNLQLASFNLYRICDGGFTGHCYDKTTQRRLLYAYARRRSSHTRRLYASHWTTIARLPTHADGEQLLSHGGWSLGQ